MKADKVRLKDVAYGIIIPVIVGLVIVAFPAVFKVALDSWFPPPTVTLTGSPYAFITTLLTVNLAMVVVFSIPLILGLVWNRWAGGAAGFVVGAIYYCAYAGYYTSLTGLNMWRDPSLMGNFIVGAMLVGYIAGSLNKGSSKITHMLASGLTAAVIVGMLQFFFNATVALYGAAKYSTNNPVNAFLLTMLPNLLLGVIAPLVGKVVTWYGMYPAKHH